MTDQQLCQRQDSETSLSLERLKYWLNSFNNVKLGSWVLERILFFKDRQNSSDWTEQVSFSEIFPGVHSTHNQRWRHYSRLLI